MAGMNSRIVFLLVRHVLRLVGPRAAPRISRRRTMAGSSGIAGPRRRAPAPDSPDTLVGRPGGRGSHDPTGSGKVRPEARSLFPALPHVQTARSPPRALNGATTTLPKVGAPREPEGLDSAGMRRTLGHR